VARRIEEPYSFPFVDDHPQIFAGEQQLLDAPFGCCRVEWQDATDGSRETDGQKGELQDATHREFLHERLQWLRNLVAQRCTPSYKALRRHAVSRLG